MSVAGFLCSMAWGFFSTHVGMEAGWPRGARIAVAFLGGALIGVVDQLL
jgi:hypothetical protein